MPDTVLETDELIQGRFRVQGPRGWGSYGVVWKAWHEFMQRPLALKEITVSGMDRETRERVLREAQIGGQLQGAPHIVQVFDAFEHKQALLIVMAYMEGGSLDVRLRNEQVPFVLALQWALDLTTALEQVHSAGIIHRDIKPQNILLDAKGNVYVSDFGIAHVDKSHLTHGPQPGTKRYKAPELEDGRPATPAADVYSLCAVFFQLWSGMHYADLQGYPTEVVRAELLSGFSTSHSEIAPELREALADAILKGLLPLDQRSSLAQLKKQLLGIQSRLNATGQPVIAATQAAQERVAAALPPIPSVVVRTTDGEQSQGTALINWLVESFDQSFRTEVWEGTRRTLFFWFDNQGLWEPLLDELAMRLALIRDKGSLLEVRYQIERRDESTPTVVYLRRTPQEIGYLAPYRPLVRNIELEPYNLIQEHQIALPTSSKQRQQVQELMPKLIAASKGKGVAFWQRVVNPDTARAALLGDVQEQVLKFVADPVRVWGEICDNNQETLFVQELSNRFGFTSPDADPELFAQGLFNHWCVVEVFLLYDQPANYPFRQVLPSATRWSHCRSALRQLRYDSRAQDTYVRRCRNFEQAYSGLETWAQTQTAEINDPPLPGLAALAWNRTRTLVAGWDNRDAVIAGIRSHLSRFREAAQEFWSQRGEITGWHMLVQAGETILQADEAITHNQFLNSPGEFVDAYCSRWWKVDSLYRAYRSSQVDTLESAPLHVWVDKMYRSYLEQVNRRWTESLSQIHQWPPDQLHQRQDSLWSQVAQGGQRRAVFFVDALRYDIAQETISFLSEEQTELDTALAGLPTITPLGMSALLPRAGDQRVYWEGDWKIAIDQESLNLAKKADRLTWLTKNLPGMHHVELADLARPRTKIPTGPWLIVFSSELDSWGENSSQLSFDAISTFAQRLAQAIRKVLDAGYEIVHVLTDHGFLLVSDIDETDKVAIPPVEHLKRDQRYILGRELVPRSTLLSFSVRNSGDLYGYYPHGVASFTSAGSYHYSHGGPSLQEVVIPHLTVRRVLKASRIMVHLEIPQIIHNAVFKIELAPEQRSLFDEAREVRLVIERVDGVKIFEIVEIVDSGSPVRKNIQLRPSHGVTYGSNLTFTLYDAHTGEELERKAAVSQVDLDL